MTQENTPGTEVEDWLNTLGVATLCEWDVLVFLFRHQTTLIGADYLASLLGYATEPVVAALNVLESLGFVERSRVSQGARLYQFSTPSAPPRGAAFERLLVLAGHRAGRLRLAKQLRRGERTSAQGLGAAERGRAEISPIVRAARQLLQPNTGRRRWRKAI